MSVSRWWAQFGSCAAGLLLVSACGSDTGEGADSGGSAGDGGSGSTSCEEFVTWSPTKRDQLVSKLAVELDVPDAVTPLGRPNVEYYCHQDPGMTVAESVALIGGDTSTPSETATADATPELTGPSIIGTMALTDEQGYTFDLQFEVELGEPTSDLTDAPPGMIDIAVPYSVLYSIHNTSEGRNAPLNVLQDGSYGGSPTTIAAVYPDSSPICALQAYDISPLLFETVGTPGMSSKDLPYCTLSIPGVFAELAGSGSELAPDETATATASGLFEYQVEETAAEQLISAFGSEPTTWVAELPQAPSDCYWDWAANETVLCNGGEVQVG